MDIRKQPDPNYRDNREQYTIPVLQPPEADTVMVEAYMTIDHQLDPFGELEDMLMNDEPPYWSEEDIQTQRDKCGPDYQPSVYAVPELTWPILSDAIKSHIPWKDATIDISGFDALAAVVADFKSNLSELRDWQDFNNARAPEPWLRLVATPLHELYRLILPDHELIVRFPFITTPEANKNIVNSAVINRAVPVIDDDLVITALPVFDSQSLMANQIHGMDSVPLEDRWMMDDPTESVDGAFQKYGRFPEILPIFLTLEPRD